MGVMAVMRQGSSSNLQMLIQKLAITLGGLDAVFLAAEAVPFIGEHNIFDGDVVVADGLNEFIAFDLQHAWVVRSLNYQQRLANSLGVEQGRNPPQSLTVARGIAEF